MGIDFFRVGPPSVFSVIRTRDNGDKTRRTRDLTVVSDIEIWRGTLGHGHWESDTYRTLGVGTLGHGHYHGGD